MRIYHRLLSISLLALAACADSDPASIEAAASQSQGPAAADRVET